MTEERDSLSQRVQLLTQEYDVQQQQLENQLQNTLQRHQQESQNWARRVKDTEEESDRLVQRVQEVEEQMQELKRKHNSDSQASASKFAATQEEYEEKLNEAQQELEASAREVCLFDIKSHVNRFPSLRRRSKSRERKRRRHWVKTEKCSTKKEIPYLLSAYFFSAFLHVRVQEAKYETERTKKNQKAQQIELLQHLSANFEITQEGSDSWVLMSDIQLHEMIKTHLNTQTDRIQELSSNLAVIETKCAHVQEKLQKVMTWGWRCLPV